MRGSWGIVLHEASLILGDGIGDFRCHLMGVGDVLHLDVFPYAFFELEVQCAEGEEIPQLGGGSHTREVLEMHRCDVVMEE